MRKYLLTLGIGVAGVVIAAYLTRILPPFNADTINQIVTSERILSEEELLQAINRLSLSGSAVLLLNWRNLLIILAIGGLGIASLAAFLHLVLAKLTSSAFTLKPKASTAVRRGVEVSILAVCLIIFKLTLADGYLFILAPLFLVILEFAITQQLYVPEVIDEQLGYDDFAEQDTTQPFVKSLQSPDKRKDPTQIYDMPEESRHIEENADNVGDEPVVEPNIAPKQSNDEQD